MKRVFDFLAATIGLVLASPVLFPVLFLVWYEDKHSPFYIAPRMGRDERPFRMVKLRSMVINADKSGVDSTSAGDPRITRVGHFIRRFKLDELTQLWNVVLGDMSLVGPRPNVERETRMYTPLEKVLLTVRPGITDYASIVFSDEAQILRGQPDADIAYNQLIRPWKGHFGLFYVANRTFWLDLKLIAITLVAIVSRNRALNGVVSDLRSRGAAPELLRVASRTEHLLPTPPPGSDFIVTERY
jgi:lipopolysaccharide/colanic/teichoic acid biosynthesis glycosyltransferase